MHDSHGGGMTTPGNRRGTAESIRSAFRDHGATWLTLPDGDEDLPEELRHAIEIFDAGERPAARTATEWLQNDAHDSFATSRTRVLIEGQRIAGYHSLASASVALSQRDRREIGARHVRVPATLVAWIAKDIHAPIDGKELLLHAAAKAREAAWIQATTVLALDAFDEETAAMWRQRYGFRRSAEDGPRERLWLAL